MEVGMFSFTAAAAAAIEGRDETIAVKSVWLRLRIHLREKIAEYSNKSWNMHLCYEYLGCRF